MFLRLKIIIIGREVSELAVSWWELWVVDPHLWSSGLLEYQGLDSAGANWDVETVLWVLSFDSVSDERWNSVVFGTHRRMLFLGSVGVELAHPSILLLVFQVVEESVADRYPANWIFLLLYFYFGHLQVNSEGNFFLFLFCDLGPGE